MPFINDKVVVPGIAVTSAGRPQVLTIFAGLAMNNPGLFTPMRLSDQLAFVNGKTFGLKMVTLRTDTPPASICRGVNCLFISAGSDAACAGISGPTTRALIMTDARKINLKDFI